MEKPQTLGSDLLSKRIDPCRIAARTRKVGNESELNGVFGYPEDDRDRRCRSLSHQCSDLKAGYDNGCYGLMDQVGQHFGHPVILALQQVVFDRDVLTVDIAGRVEAFDKTGEFTRRGIDRSGIEKPNYRDRRLLSARR